MDMSAVAELVEAAPTAFSAEEVSDDRLARRNAVVLAAAQALAGANNTVIVSTGGIIGIMLAPDKAMATLPITLMVVGMWAGTLPVGAAAHALGRRAALQIGSAFGVLGGLVGALAVAGGSFGLFLLGTFCCGVYAAGHQSYRFAAADRASPKFRPKAVAWVLSGGVFAGVLGPQLVIFTKDLWAPYLFAATYVAQAAVAALAAAVLMLVRIPRRTARLGGGTGRPLIEIARAPRFLVAVACGVASYAMMNLVMTSAPVAMVACNHSMTEAALGLQWHVLGMYLPSFFTGALIARLGVERVIGLGLLLLMASAAINVTGVSVWHFWIGLALLGVGWNFGFIGATALVTQCYRPAECTKVQAFNDFLIFGSMAIGSAASGLLLASVGWTAVNQMVFPVVLLAGALLMWLAWRRQPLPV
jgi:predicted MFS family arabinose efflux permease